MEPQTNANPTSTEPAAPQHGMGPLVGTLIVLAILVLGGVYFLTSETQMPPEPPPVILGDANELRAQVTPPPSNSDAVNDISADVEATDLNALEAEIDADLQAIEANL